MALSSSVEAGKPLIECDAGMFLSIFAAKASAALGSIFEQLESLDDDSKLMLFVIYEKFENPKSFWKPYLDLLPASIDSALYFGDEDIEYLNGTTLGMEIQMTQKHLREAYDAIVDTIGGRWPEAFSCLSWERFKWARAMFDSRGFNLTLQGKARNCLLPFIDSLNTMHYTPVQTRGLVDERKKSGKSDLGTYVLPTICDLDEGRIGEQVCLNYGGFSTRELVMFYGFAYAGEPNPYDTFNLDLDAPEDALAPLRLELAQKLNISTEHYLRSQSLSTNLLCYLSLVLLPPSLLKLAAKRPASELRKLLLTPGQLKPVKTALTSLLEALVENMTSANPHLVNPPPSFPSECARLGFVYSQSQLTILKASLDLVASM